MQLNGREARVAQLGVASSLRPDGTGAIRGTGTRVQALSRHGGKSRRSELTNWQLRFSRLPPVQLSLLCGLLPAKDSSVKSELYLISEVLRLIPAGALHCLPVEVLDLEGTIRLPLLERIEIREGDSAAEPVLRLRGLEVEGRRVDRDIGESRHCRRNRKGPGVVILLLVAVHVPAGDRQVVVDHDSGRRLELECGAELPVDHLLAIERSELLVGQVEDPHLLVVGERLVVAHNEGLPEMLSKQDIAEPPAFDSLRFATCANVDEVVG